MSTPADSRSSPQTNSAAPSYPPASLWIEHENKWVVLRHEWEGEGADYRVVRTEMVFASEELGEAQDYLKRQPDRHENRYDLLFNGDDWLPVDEDRL